MSEYLSELKLALNSLDGLEAKLDGIRRYKNEKQNPLRAGFLEGKFSLKTTMEALTGLADAILITAFEIASEKLQPHWGVPHYRDGRGKLQPGELAIIGMGKLGGGELHFSSDLDVIFIFNHNGETTGAKPITNREYFAKVAQRLISYLTLYTAGGYAYKVDTELRPSGLAGALVTPLDSWIAYYREMAQIWERQALLKARLIHGTGRLPRAFQNLFKNLIFIRPFPETLADEIHHLRNRIEKELAKETNQRWHFKKGYGGLVDIEFLVQYLQLKWGTLHEDLLTPNTLEAIEKIHQRGILPAQRSELLKNAYEFYRKLEFHLALNFQWSEGYLNPRTETPGKVARLMGFKSKEKFLNAFGDFRHHVRKIYLETLNVKER